MHEDRYGSGATYVYIVRRVWQRLLLAVYGHRTVVLGVVIALLVLGLFWLRAALQGQAAVVGVMPIPVTVQPLAASGGSMSLILREQNGSRELGVDLDLTSAPVIALQQGVPLPVDQPQVYDLLRDVVQQLGGRVDHVVISETDEGMYRAQIVVSMGSDLLVVRAKAADAATLALKTGAPIFVENSLFQSTSGLRAVEN